MDECAEGIATCPRGRRCSNTYGNYLCLCQEGYKFQYVNGKLSCVGEYSQSYSGIKPSVIILSFFFGFHYALISATLGKDWMQIMQGRVGWTRPSIHTFSNSFLPSPSPNHKLDGSCMRHKSDRSTGHCPCYKLNDNKKLAQLMSVLRLAQCAITITLKGKM